MVLRSGQYGMAYSYLELVIPFQNPTYTCEMLSFNSTPLSQNSRSVTCWKYYVTSLDLLDRGRHYAKICSLIWEGVMSWSWVVLVWYAWDGIIDQLAVEGFKKKIECPRPPRFDIWDSGACTWKRWQGESCALVPVAIWIRATRWYMLSIAALQGRFRLA